jgi:hypothetical protein
MEDVKYGELERKWHEANEIFKDLDHRYKQADTRAKELQKQAARLFAERIRTPKELLFEEIQARREQLDQERRSAIEEVEQRAAAEIKEIHRFYGALSTQVDQEFEPRVAPYRVPVTDKYGDGCDGWDDFEPEEEFHTPEFNAVRAEIDALHELMRSLRGPRTQGRNVLNEARNARLRARRQL